MLFAISFQQDDTENNLQYYQENTKKKIYSLSISFLPLLPLSVFGFKYLCTF
jgi:hypothetical protein